jgi:diacylglycerol kinase
MKLLRSFGYAFAGLMAALKGQQNIRIHLVALAVVCFSGFYFKITSLEWCIILLTSGLVIGLELLNTAIESLTDLVTKEKKPLAGKVKDISAAAVLFASIIALIIGTIIFAGHIIPIQN